MVADLRKMQENQGVSENRIDKFRFVYLFLIGCRMTVLHFSGATFLASDR